MSARPVMLCTEDQYHGLVVAVDRARETSKTVTVDKAALSQLLKDHSNLLAHHRGTVEEYPY